MGLGSIESKEKSYQSEVSAFEINRDIQHYEDIIKTAFKKFEFKASIPTQTELRDTINHLLGKNVGKPRELLRVQEAFGAYVLDLSNEKTLSDSTYAKLKTVKTILKEFDSELFLNDITKEKLDEYVQYLINERGLQNTTIKKNLTFVKTFLKYCDNRKLIDTDWKTHFVELKTIGGKNIVFLDMQEFERVYNLEFPENKQYLERARDVFAFQCLTSLRYSDVAKLKKTDIVDDYLHSVTEKTDTVLKISLNDKAKAILAKYRDLQGECALFIEELYRGNQYPTLLIDKAKADTARMGFQHMYLSTDLIGYNERYGFCYVGQGYHPWNQESRIYEIKL